MRRIVLSAICVVLCASVTLAEATEASKATDQAAEKQIRQVEEELRAAVVKGDAATFERVLADDYTTTNLNGLTRTKSLRGTDTSGHQRMIRVLVKRQDRWQPVAMQATAIK